MKQPNKIKSEADHPPYSSASIANMFLNKAFLESRTISPMQIQKLLYLAHGHYLHWTGKPLIDEVFQAWKFGPVLASIYVECKEYGKSGITKFLSENEMSYENGSFRFQSFPAPLPVDDEIEELIKFVWDSYKDYEPFVLSRWTHEKGGPWDEVTQGGHVILKNMEVPNEVIRKYFERKLEK